MNWNYYLRHVIGGKLLFPVGCGQAITATLSFNLIFERRHLSRISCTCCCESRVSQLSVVCVCACLWAWVWPWTCMHAYVPACVCGYVCVIENRCISLAKLYIVKMIFYPFPSFNTTLIFHKLSSLMCVILYIRQMHRDWGHLTNGKRIVFQNFFCQLWDMLWIYSLFDYILTLSNR